MTTDLISSQICGNCVVVTVANVFANRISRFCGWLSKLFGLLSKPPHSLYFERLSYFVMLEMSYSGVILKSLLNRHITLSYYNSLVSYSLGILKNHTLDYTFNLPII